MHMRFQQEKEVINKYTYVKRVNHRRGIEDESSLHRGNWDNFTGTMNHLKNQVLQESSDCLQSFIF